MKFSLIYRSVTLLLLGISTSYAISTNEQWLRYPAISPDGTQVVFTHKGDIYEVAVEGGKARPLTTSDAIDYMPVWSHDGKSIAFASNREGNFDVYVMPAEGGKAKRLTYHSANDLPSDFSTDDKSVIFSSVRQDDVKSAQFPYGLLGELYAVDVMGGTPQQLLTTPTENAKINNKSNLFIYQDVKGYEDPWRKHEVSSRSRDVWVVDPKTNKHQKLTQFAGDDRNPVWNAENTGFYYLSEKDGNFNVWYQAINKKAAVEGDAVQISHQVKHPVRFLSVSKNNDLLYGYHGALFIQKKGSHEASNIPVSFAADDRYVEQVNQTFQGDASEMAVSPSGKEIAFVVRGEVFVTSTDFATTKRITNTPEQERSVSFSPDGRSVLYASERGNSWKIFQTSIVREQEKYFATSTLLTETALVSGDKEAFQPSYSPDGTEVAYLEERTTLKVVNLKSKQSRLILSGLRNYSYQDGDQWYQWSPDGKWLEVDMLEKDRWMGEIGIVSAKGGEEPVNITNSGYSDSGGTWAMDGNAIIWVSARNGMRSHGSWGSQLDVYAAFLNQDTYDKFSLSKQDYELLKEQQEQDKKNNDKKDKKDKDEKKAKKSKTATSEKDQKTAVKPIDIAFNQIEDHTKRLTVNSSDLAGAQLTKEGTKLYYLSQFEKGYDLWVTDFKENETKILMKLGAKHAYFVLDKEQKNAFVLADGKIKKIELESKKVTPVAFNAEMTIDANSERKYLFEHIWRQVLKKFYVADLHGVDWAFYKKEYAIKLNDINNNFDFAELTGEMLGELNASHTGTRYRPHSTIHNSTASLGIFPDNHYSGTGIKIAEILPKSPLVKANSKVEVGDVIEKIDGQEISSKHNYYPLLTNKEGDRVLLSIYSPKTNKRWDQVIRPVSQGQMADLKYHRWVQGRKDLTEKLSHGRIGYVHVKGMNDESFRTVYSELLGKLVNKEAVIVDTRFNGGGWLHDDLATLLSGKRYMDFVPRGQKIGSEPLFKWYRPSIVVMGEGNYSDAHMFPYTYKALNIGPLVGMPVPGTGTAVWWEALHTGDLIFGIPQVGMIGLDAKYLENHQLNPDYMIDNDPESVANGEDKQIEKSVQVLLEKLDQNK